MANYITEGLREGGTEVKQLSMHSNHRSDVATELLDASALLIGSPVLNSQIFPAMADVLCYLKGLRKKGWSARRSARTAGTALRWTS